jgi:hypothetical protein
MLVCCVPVPQVIRASAKTKGFVRLPETYVNLGNLWLARQQYNDALTMYEHASKLHNHKNAQVCQCTAVRLVRCTAATYLFCCCFCWLVAQSCLLPNSVVCSFLLCCSCTTLYPSF